MKLKKSGYEVFVTSYHVTKKRDPYCSEETHKIKHYGMYMFLLKNHYNGTTMDVYDFFEMRV